MTDVRWLRCRVDKGMFSDELAVTYPAEGEYQKSVFVPKIDVDGERGIGRVRVLVTELDGAMYATLPSPTGDMVAVASQDICG